MRGLLRRFVTDAHGRVVIAQWPNLPLLGWLASTLLARVLGPSTLREGIAFLGTAFLFTWAWLESTDGASPFRRALGVVVAAWIVWRQLFGG